MRRAVTPRDWSMLAARYPKLVALRDQILASCIGEGRQAALQLLLNWAVLSLRLIRSNQEQRLRVADLGIRRQAVLWEIECLQREREVTVVPRWLDVNTAQNSSQSNVVAHPSVFGKLRQAISHERPNCASRLALAIDAAESEFQAQISQAVQLRREYLFALISLEGVESQIREAVNG